jgi:hypothetical protein
MLSADDSDATNLELEASNVFSDQDMTSLITCCRQMIQMLPTLN